MLNINVKDYGAKADGVTLDTEAIQKAIDAAGEAGGGRVILEGGTFLSARLDLRSYVELHIEADATLLATTDGSAFKEIESDFWDTSMAPRRNKKCFIYAENCHDIALTGRGKIDCQGRNAVAPCDAMGLWKYNRVVFDLPARMVFFIGCKDVLCEDVLLYEPCAGWGYWICDCERVDMRGLRIDSNRNYPNADGIHVNCSRDVHISDCDIIAGDDAIIVRAYNGPLREKKPCERVTVTNCTLSSFQACIRIAWIGDGEIKNCVFSNLTFTNSNCGIRLHIPGVPEGKPNNFTDDGGDATHIENLLFENIAIDSCVTSPIEIIVYPGNKIDLISGIRFNNILSKSGRMPVIKSRDEAPIERVTFSNCTFERKYFETVDGFIPNSDGSLIREEAPMSPTFVNVRELRLCDVTFDT